MWYIQGMGHFSALKRKEILLQTTPEINSEGIMLSIISQSQKGFIIPPM